MVVQEVECNDVLVEERIGLTQRQNLLQVGFETYVKGIVHHLELQVFYSKFYIEVLDGVEKVLVLGFVFADAVEGEKFVLAQLFSQEDVWVREAEVDELHGAAEPDLGLLVVGAIVNELKRMVDALVGECLLNNKLLIIGLDARWIADTLCALQVKIGIAVPYLHQVAQLENLYLFVLPIDEVFLWILAVEHANKLVVSLDRQPLEIDLVPVSQNFVHGVKLVEALALVGPQLGEQVLGDLLVELGLYLEHLQQCIEEQDFFGRCYHHQKRIVEDPAHVCDLGAVFYKLVDPSYGAQWSNFRLIILSVGLLIAIIRYVIQIYVQFIFIFVGLHGAYL